MFLRIALPLLSEEMTVKGEEGEERGAEKYLREVMGIVEEKEQRREQQRRTRRKEAEEGGKARRQEAKATKLKVEKGLVEEEMVCQGPLIVTKVFFLVSLCLFLTSSALLLSDYKQKDSLALRQTVGTLGQNYISLILKKSDFKTYIFLILGGKPSQLRDSRNAYQVAPSSNLHC